MKLNNDVCRYNKLASRATHAYQIIMNSTKIKTGKFGVCTATSN
jgi:hypothetical protein